MAADFPENVVNLPNKSDGEKLYAAEYNKIVDEITAIETELKKPAADTIVQAADSAKLGGVAPSGYLGASAQAADSAKLGGKLPAYYFTAWQSWVPTLNTGDAVLSGYTSARYCKVGTTVLFTIGVGNKDVTGSSGLIEIGLPIATSANTGELRFVAYAYPISGSYAPVMAQVYQAASVIRVAKGLFSQPWLGTETGVYIFINGFYEVA